MCSLTKEVSVRYLSFLAAFLALAWAGSASAQVTGTITCPSSLTATAGSITAATSTTCTDITATAAGSPTKYLGIDGGGALKTGTPAAGVTCGGGSSFAYDTTTGRCSYTVTASALGSTLCGNGTLVCIAFTGLTGSEYQINCHGMQGGSGNNIALQFGEGATPTWETGAGSYHLYTPLISNSSTGIEINAPPVALTVAGTTAGWLHDLNSTTLNKTMNFLSNNASSGSPFYYYEVGNGTYTGDTGAITAVRIIDMQGTPANMTVTSVCTLTYIT
jgi:hypothetical protein